MTNKLALVVAVVLGVLSIVGIRLYVEGIENKNLQEKFLIDVLVASKDLPAQKVFGADDVDIAQLPSTFVDQAFRKSHITDRTTVIGTRLIHPVAAGQVLQTYHFQNRQSDRGRVKPGAEYRAITIPISRVGGVGGLLRPADLVDLVVNMNISDKQSGQNLTVTFALFRNVLILACDTNTDPFVEMSGYGTITLRLSPEDCNKLAYCLFNGATIHMLYVQPGTPPAASSDPVTPDKIWQDIRDDVRTMLQGG